MLHIHNLEFRILKILSFFFIQDQGQSQHFMSTFVVIKDIELSFIPNIWQLHLSSFESRVIIIHQFSIQNLCPVIKLVGSCRNMNQWTDMRL